MRDRRLLVQDPTTCWEERDEAGDGGCESPAPADDPKPRCSLAPELSVGAGVEAVSITRRSRPSGAGDRLPLRRAQLAVPLSQG